MVVGHTLLTVLQKQVWGQTGLHNKFQDSQDYKKKKHCLRGGNPHKFMILQGTN